MSAQLSGQPELRLPVTHWQPRGRLAAWAALMSEASAGWAASVNGCPALLLRSSAGFGLLIQVKTRTWSPSPSPSSSMTRMPVSDSSFQSCDLWTVTHLAALDRCWPLARFQLLVGSGPRYMILCHTCFARCASQNTVRESHAFRVRFPLACYSRMSECF